eukprot:m.31449 g.31449  ORF g.31449 m.31449 type:complete len:627 (+) comp12321_c0_seq1:65-1945(+)
MAEWASGGGDGRAPRLVLGTSGLPNPAYSSGLASPSKTKTSRSCVRRWRGFTTFQKILLGALLVVVCVVMASPPSQRITENIEPRDHIKRGAAIEAAVAKLRDENTRLSQALDVARRPREEVEVVHVPLAGEQDSQHVAQDAVDTPPPPPPPLAEKAPRGDGAVESSNPLAHAGPKNERQQAVVDAFKWAWKAYKTDAWGKDELKPISHSSETWFNLGLTLIDSLDTMLLMGMTDEYNEARVWVERSLDLTQNKDVNLFECTIRVLGGLLSTYALTGDELYNRKAVDLGDRLMHAFDSPSKVPYSDVNIGTLHAHKPKWGPDSSTSEVTTIQLEFRELSRITKDPKYAAAVDEVMEHVKSLPKEDGLVPIWISADSGNFRKGTITLGARGDSYYEYLLKQWLQTDKTDPRWKEMYTETVDGIFKRLVHGSIPNNYTYIAELINGRVSPKMDHLVCFLPGLLALGAVNGFPHSHMDLAKDLIKTCNAMYTHMPTGLAPEITFFNDKAGGTADLIVKDNDAHNLLRPETVESMFVMHRLTGDKQYAEWGWAIFQAFEKHCRIPSGGYSSLRSVKNIPVSYRDKMESFFLGETLKYLFLLFESEPNLVPLDKWVFNTEAHPLPIFHPST